VCCRNDTKISNGSRPWLEHHLTDTPVAHATLVRPFLHWFLLRRARNRASARRYPVSIGRDLRRRVLVALDLLAWLDEQRITLKELRQGDVDRRLDEDDSQRRHRIRSFLKWATDRGLTTTLTVPLIPRQQPADLLDDQQRWHLLHRCLTDDALPVDVRAAGALILLFGLQAQRIRHLNADHVVLRDGNTYLTAGPHPILLPPRLGALLRGHLILFDAVSGGLRGGNRWPRSHSCMVGSGTASGMDTPRRSYRSDLSNARWALVEPLLAAWRAQRVGLGITKPRHDLREIVNAILYVNRTGIAWEYLPHDFPPYKTVYDYHPKWEKDGVAEAIHDALTDQPRATQTCHRLSKPGIELRKRSQPLITSCY
jgi:transposase